MTTMREKVLTMVFLALMMMASFSLGVLATTMPVSSPGIIGFVENQSRVNEIDDDYMRSVLGGVSREQFADHVYVNDSFVCLDYSVNMWDVLYARGITSSIMVGNHTGPCYDFGCADHAWVVVRSQTKTFALETTRGTVEEIGPDDNHLKAMEFESPIAFKTAWATYYRAPAIYWR
jgi:hypothetical protein